MSVRHSDNIPRFLPQTENKWPWANCTVGEEAMLRKFPLLAGLNIPLGMTPADQACRDGILASLLSVNDSTSGKQRMKGLKDKFQVTGGNNTDHVYVRVPQGKGESDKAHRRLHDFFDLVIGSLPNNLTDENDEDDEETKKIECWLQWAAKKHPKVFLKKCKELQETAEECEKKRLKKEPFQAPPDLEMYDGGDREEPLHVNWNIMYRALKAYKEEHGDCLVSSRSKEHPPEQEERLKKLSRWINSQRSARRQKSASLTSKRIELLDSIGFAWELNRDHANHVDDVRFQKAIAAKLFFQETLTAKEAMLMSGYPLEEATNDNRKKNMNNIVCRFYSKRFKCSNAVEKILGILQQTYLGNEEAVLQQVFGTHDIVPTLIQQGKLVARPAKRQSADGDDDDTNHSHESNSDDMNRSPPRKRPALPLQRYQDRYWT